MIVLIIFASGCRNLCAGPSGRLAELRSSAALRSSLSVIPFDCCSRVFMLHRCTSALIYSRAPLKIACLIHGRTSIVGRLVTLICLHMHALKSYFKIMQVTGKSACPRWEFIWQRSTRARCGLYIWRATLLDDSRALFHHKLLPFVIPYQTRRLITIIAINDVRKKTQEGTVLWPLPYGKMQVRVGGSGLRPNLALLSTTWPAVTKCLTNSLWLSYNHLRHRDKSL